MKSVNTFENKICHNILKKTQYATTNSAGNSRAQYSAWHITKSLNGTGTMQPSPRNWWRTAKSIKNATCREICGYSDWQALRFWKTSQPWAASTLSNVRDMSVLQTVTWKNETTKSCCHSGKVVLALWDNPPQEFKQFLKTCPFWSRPGPPAASWHWHPWVYLLQIMSGLTSTGKHLKMQVGYFIFQQTLQIGLYFGDTWFISPLFVVACPGRWTKPLLWFSTVNLWTSVPCLH